MAFDIHQTLFSPDGEYLEEEALAYQDEIMERFAESPEGQAILQEGGILGYAATFMEYALSYESAALPEVSTATLQTVLFSLFPRKVMLKPEDARDVVRTLRAFFTFSQREFGLANLAACIRDRTDAAASRLQRALADPRNFGMAKSFMAAGLKQGYDLSTEEGMLEWTTAYNQQLAGKQEVGKGEGALGPYGGKWPDDPDLLGAGTPPSLVVQGEPARSSSAARRKKTEASRRKMAHESRRKNAKRK